MNLNVLDLGLRAVLILNLVFAPLLTYGQARPVQTVIGEVDEWNQLIQESQKITAGQPQGSFAPDRFLLLEQSVHNDKRVGRAFGLFSTPIEREIEEHRSRLWRLNLLRQKAKKYVKADSVVADPCAPHAANEQLSAAYIKESVIQHINEGRKQDTPPFIWDNRLTESTAECVAQRLVQLEKEWSDQIDELWEKRGALEEVPNVTSAPEKSSRRALNWWDMSLKIRSASNAEDLGVIEMKTTADRHSIDDTNSFKCSDGENCRFNLEAGGKRMHSFNFPVAALTTFGPYIVFVHSNSYDPQTGVQYLSFMDLATFGPSLGESEIPVFRLPIAIEQEVTGLRVNNGKLVLNNGKEVIVEAFMAASELQQVAFNTSANLSDPGTIAEVLPYIDRLRDVFGRIAKEELHDKLDELSSSKSNHAQVLLDDLGKDLKAQIDADSRLSSFAAGKTADISIEDAAKVTDITRKVLAKYSEDLSSADILRRRSAKTAQRVRGGRELGAQISGYLNRIMSPAPNASLKIKRALVAIGAQSGPTPGAWLQFISDRPWLASFVLSSAVMAGVAPEVFTTMLQGSLAVGNAIFDYGKFALLGLGESFVTATSATFKPIVDGGASFAKQYIDDGNWQKTMIGLSVFVPSILGIFFIPNFLFNAHKVWLDSKKPNWTGLVDHQREFVRDYYQRLGNDEIKRRQLQKAEDDGPLFTESEEAEIRAFIENRKSEKESKSGYLSKFARNLGQQFARLKQAIGGSKAVQDVGAGENIRGKWSAIRSMLFSYPAMELSLSRWVKFWNWFAGTRYNSVGFLTLRDVGLKYNIPVFIRPKPVTATVRLLFPDFFTTTVSARGPKVTMPTVLNGGTRMWGVRDMVWLKEVFFGKPSEQRQSEEDYESARVMTASEMKAVTEQFERDVLDVEDQVHHKAFQAAIHALPDFVTNKEDLLKLFKDKPLKSVIEKRVRDLPGEIRTFLRLYVEEVYSLTMTEVLSKLMAREQGQLDLEVTTGKPLKDMKQEILELRRQAGNSDAFLFDKEAAAQIADRVIADPGVYKRVATQARKGEWSLNNWITNRRFNVIGDMDPEQNPSMKRFSVVEERLKSPNALSRATRAEIAKLIITFPLDLLFKMVLTAGIFEGAAKPIQDTFWGTNSVAYFSQTGFYMTMAAGFTMSMMADAWVKLQMDARQDELGDFGALPKGEDAEKSYLSWYYKQFTAKNNTIMANWQNSNYITFWNLPAALFNMSLFYYAFSGRFDLSYLFAGYVMAFGTPFNAFYYKLDQAFERSVEYAARGIKDEKWLAHPDVQDMISGEKQGYRLRFQMFSDVYMSIQGNWIANVELIKTSLGPRGFTRAILGGVLVEEAIIEKLLHPVVDVTQNIPVVGQLVGKMAETCEYLITNGNPDIRLKK